MQKTEDLGQSDSLVKNTRRKAEFIVEGESTYIKFINKSRLIHRYITKTFPQLKRYINSVIQKIGLWVSKVSWRLVAKEVKNWLIEATIEGISANFVTHILLGVPFTPGMILAHGFAIKHGISIWWRLRRDGSASKIPYKDKSDFW